MDELDYIDLQNIFAKLGGEETQALNSFLC